MIVDVEDAGFCAFHRDSPPGFTGTYQTHEVTHPFLARATVSTISLRNSPIYGIYERPPGAPDVGQTHAHFSDTFPRIHNAMIEPGQSLRVLCADDNVMVLDMLSKTLQSAGHLVEVATDGRAAVSRVEQDPEYFHLIVTDTRMPRLDGFGVVEKARSAGFAGQIIVFANALSDEDRQRYTDLRVDRVINKPGKPGELVGAIRELRASLA
jgi:two-component system, chemotaxis family, chemotaxis protein CheY